MGIQVAYKKNNTIGELALDGLEIIKAGGDTGIKGFKVEFMDNKPLEPKVVEGVDDYFNTPQKTRPAREDELKDIIVSIGGKLIGL